MPPRRALALLEPVVSALGAAHRAGLIHRDVKPENVLIADEAHGGRIKVADFGLAKAVSADTQHTATGGVLIGTVSYLAPELVVDGRADARADVYAAGVVLYELLTGRKPHEGESPIQVAYRHVHHDVPMPSLLQPGIPDYVDALVARSTSRDRDQRPADATVLLHHLHRVEQALREGLDSDPELAADLLPRRAPAVDTADTERAGRGHHPRAVRRGRAGAAHRGRPPRLRARRRRQPRPDDRPRAPPGPDAHPFRGAGDRADEGCRAGRRRGDGVASGRPRHRPSARHRDVRPASRRGRHRARSPPSPRRRAAARARDRSRSCSRSSSSPASAPVRGGSAGSATPRRPPCSVSTRPPRAPSWSRRAWRRSRASRPTARTSRRASSSPRTPSRGARSSTAAP